MIELFIDDCFFCSLCISWTWWFSTAVSTSQRLLSRGISHLIGRKGKGCQTNGSSGTPVTHLSGTFRRTYIWGQAICAVWWSIHTSTIYFLSRRCWRCWATMSPWGIAYKQYGSAPKKVWVGYQPLGRTLASNCWVYWTAGRAGWIPMTPTRSNYDSDRIEIPMVHFPW